MTPTTPPRLTAASVRFLEDWTDPSEFASADDAEMAEDFRQAVLAIEAEVRAATLTAAEADAAALRAALGEAATVIGMLRSYLLSGESLSAAEDDALLVVIAKTRAALATPGVGVEGVEFTGQMDWPCKCGHPKSDHYFGDALGADRRMHTWCQRRLEHETYACIDFTPTPSPAAPEAKP